MSRFIFILLALGLTASAAAQSTLDEVAVQLIPLAKPLNEDVAEYSGMTWCGDSLILIPQYPKRLAKRFTSSGNSYFYALAKRDILNFIDGKSAAPLQAEPIEVREGSVRARTLVFDGFEAAACDGDTLWLTIESVSVWRGYRSYLVPAKLKTIRGKPVFDIEAGRIQKLGSQSGLVNKGDEALTLWRGSVLTFHEVNSESLVKQPRAQRFNINDGSRSELPFPNLPFRLTDVSSVDKNNRFWGINYRYNRDKFSANTLDSIAERYPPGQSHRQYDNVERLLEFEISESGIELVQAPPIQLAMQDVEGRNWEALARLDDRGLLIATDKHPSTLFGFVPFLDNAESTK